MASLTSSSTKLTSTPLRGFLLRCPSSPHTAPLTSTALASWRGTRRRATVAERGVEGSRPCRPTDHFTDIRGTKIFDEEGNIVISLHFKTIEVLTNEDRIARALKLPSADCHDTCRSSPQPQAGGIPIASFREDQSGLLTSRPAVRVSLSYLSSFVVTRRKNASHGLSYTLSP